MEKVQTFKINAREVKNENKSFISCSAQINGIWYKIKFTKDCEKNPKTRGIYDLTVDVGNCSVQRGGNYENKAGEIKKENDTIWVDKIESIRKYTEEELKAMNAESLAKVFGGN